MGPQKTYEYWRGTVVLLAARNVFFVNFCSLCWSLFLLADVVLVVQWLERVGGTYGRGCLVDNAQCFCYFLIMLIPLMMSLMILMMLMMPLVSLSLLCQLFNGWKEAGDTRRRSCLGRWSTWRSKTLQERSDTDWELLCLFDVRDAML